MAIFSLFFFFFVRKYFNLDKSVIFSVGKELFLCQTTSRRYSYENVVRKGKIHITKISPNFATTTCKNLNLDKAQHKVMFVQV